MRQLPILLVLGSGLLVAAAACSSSDDTTQATTTTAATTSVGGGGGAGATGGTGGSTTEPGCTEPTAVPCSDQVIADLAFNSVAAPGLVSGEPDGAGYWSLVDATAGGAMAANPDSYVYARFTDTGLTKVDISDEDSLDSMDWDIAFRRFVVRVNSGNSGPSCVTAGRVPPADNDYDALGAVPAAMTFHADEYYSAPPTCELTPDSFGFNTPQTVISSFWTYEGCVQMTGNVYVLALADGRFVKLLFTEFYWDAEGAEPGTWQEQCNAGTITDPMSVSAYAAHVRFRWAFLP